MKLLHIIYYSLWLVWQVLIAATDVVFDTLRPRPKEKPVLIGLPLRVTSDLEVTLFAESITMTPGTLVCGVREIAPVKGAKAAGTQAMHGGANTGRLFIVHAIFGRDLDGLYDSLYDMEEHLVPSLRGTERPQAFLFEDYDPDNSINPDAVVGVAAELEKGLPLPPELRPEPNPEPRAESNPEPRATDTRATTEGER